VTAPGSPSGDDADDMAAACRLMPTQAKALRRHLDQRVGHLGAEWLERHGVARMHDGRGCISKSAPSLPPGCSTLKSTEVKPRPSSSAIASASPSASIISEEVVVGARLCGQASRAFGSVRATSAALASEDLPLRADRDHPEIRNRLA